MKDGKVKVVCFKPKKGSSVRHHKTSGHAKKKSSSKHQLIKPPSPFKRGTRLRDRSKIRLPARYR